MVLAGSAAKDTPWIRRIRTLTVGFLTPFYFIRAGTLVSLPALVSAPLVFLALLAGKVASKTFGLYPVIGMTKTGGWQVPSRSMRRRHTCSSMLGERLRLSTVEGGSCRMDDFARFCLP